MNRRRTPRPALRRHGSGFAAEGPGFYVWDEDPREVRRATWVLDARRGPLPEAPPRAPGEDARPLR